MEAATFEELSQRFTEKLAGLGEALAIQACIDSPEEDDQTETFQPMESLWQGVEELSTVLTLIRSKCAEQRKALEGVKAVKQKLQILQKSLHYTNSNVPPHLPAPTATTATHVETKDSCCTGHSLTNCSNQGQGQNLVAATLSSKKATSVVDKNRSENSNTNTKHTKPPCPLMDYLTVDEFEGVSKYMKGRLSYQQVNSVVDEMNKVLTSKYKLLRQKRSTLGDSQRERYESFKLQETKDTKGMYFVVEGDLKDLSNLKMSKDTRSILTILRHCGRMCEIRGGGVTRYALIEMY